MQLLHGHVSALIACALSMCGGGSRARLYQILKEIIESRLEVVVGQTPDEAALRRQHVHDLFLTTASDGKKKMSAFRTQWRRLVLSFFFNGDLSEDRIVFWTPMRLTKGQVLKKMLTYVVPALLPAKCPIFPRSRWHGGHLAVSWAGVLATHHNLLRRGPPRAAAARVNSRDDE